MPSLLSFPLSTCHSLLYSLELSTVSQARLKRRTRLSTLTFMFPGMVLTASLCLMNFIRNFLERTSNTSKCDIIIKLLVNAKVPTVAGSDVSTVIPLSFCYVLFYSCR